MSAIGYATLDIIPSLKGLQRELEQGTNGPMRSAGTRGGTLFGDAAGRSAGQRFGSVFTSTAKAGMLGGLAVAAGAIKLGADSIGEAREAQKVGRLTAAVIKSTGGAAKVSEKQVGNLSGRLSEMAGLDDEMIQSGANTILTFTKIRNAAGKGNKIFDRATLAALNMSSALGTDLQGASIQVGKALNDPIKGVTALGRAGVQFTEDQKAQIKAMVESGDQLGAQKVILGELTTQFGGAAKSQATSSDKLSVAFGNIKEELGTSLLPMLDKFSRFLLRDGVPAAKEFTRWFEKEGVPGIKGFADEVKPLAEKLLPAAADSFDAIRAGAKKALPIAEDLVGAFNDMPDWVKKALITGGAVTFAVNKATPNGLIPKLAQGAASKAIPIRVFETNPLALGNGGGSKPGSSGLKPLLLNPATLFAAQAGFGTHFSGKVLADAVGKEVASAIITGKGGEGIGAGLFSSDDFAGPKELARRQEAAAAASDKSRESLRSFWLEGKAADRVMKDFNGTLSATGNYVLRPRVDTTGIERAIALLERMDARLANSAQVERGTDGGVTYQHGTGGTNPRAGVTVNIEKVEAHDYDDFTRQLDRRARNAQRGGR